MEMWTTTTQRPFPLPTSTGSALSGSSVQRNPNWSLRLRDYNVSLVPGLEEYKEPTTDTSQLFDLVVLTFLAGSTTNFEFPTLNKISEIDKVAQPKRKFITWGEAIKQEAQTFDRLQKQIEEGFEAEARYWKFLDDE